MRHVSDADRKLDDTPLTFGRYGRAGTTRLTPNQVADLDPQWLVWAYENVHSEQRQVCSRFLYEACLEDGAETGAYDDQHY